jgi:hypothetical protein
VHDQARLYILAGERVAKRRGIALTSRDAKVLDAAFRRRRTIVAFDIGRRALTRAGFEFDRLPLADWPIPRLVAASRRDCFVVAAFQPEGLALSARRPRNSSAASARPAQLRNATRSRVPSPDEPHRREERHRVALAH